MGLFLNFLFCSTDLCIYLFANTSLLWLSLKIRGVIPLSFFLLFKIVLVSVVPVICLIDFRISLSIATNKNPTWILMGIAWRRRIDILTVLSPGSWPLCPFIDWFFSACRAFCCCSFWLLSRGDAHWSHKRSWAVFLFLKECVDLLIFLKNCFWFHRVFFLFKFIDFCCVIYFLPVALDLFCFSFSRLLRKTLSM